MTPSVFEIISAVHAMGVIIDAPAELIDFYTGRISYGGEKCHIEKVSKGYRYGYEEGGILEWRYTCKTADDLLYVILSCVTSRMAAAYELAHRDERQDFRRVKFTHQMLLLDQLKPSWKSKRRNEIEIILNEAPYEDNL